MTNKLGLAVCDQLAREAAAVFGTTPYDDVIVIAFPALCHIPHQNWDNLAGSIQKQAGECQQVRIFGAQCLARLGAPPAGMEHCQIRLMDSCAGFFLGESAARRYAADGQLLMPGWVADWREHVAAQPDEVKAMLGPDDKRLLLVDTAVDPDGPARIAELAQSYGRQHGDVPAGTDGFRTLLEQNIASWRLEFQRVKLNAILANAYRRLNDYTMVQELIGSLAESLAEDKVIEKVFELFTVLLAPEKMVFASMNEGKLDRVWSRPAEYGSDEGVRQRLAGFRRAYAWTEDGNGFVLGVRHRSKPLGVLEVRGISSLEYKEHYLDMALTISRVCGMAISNARLYRDLKGPNRVLVEFAEDLQDALAARKRAEEKQAQLLKQVESANKELAEFAYVVSHDLKAPLRAIDSLVRWLVDDYGDKFDDDGREQIGLLLGRVRRMHNLIDGILQYSRVGRVRENRVDVDLGVSVPEVIDLLAPPAHIKVVVETPLPTVTAEKTRIEQVFQNLLSNAVKYMDKPQGLIRVGCLDDGDHWRFYVADNGPGIEEKDFERIFLIFQTGKPRDQVDSTGVGLAVVKKAVELYGGRIWVESRIGEGSTFFFTYPKKLPEAVV